MSVPCQKQSSRVQLLFMVLVMVVFSLCNIALAFFVINWSRIVSIVLFALLVFFNFSFALLLSKRILSFFVPPFQMPKSNTLRSKPRVAVLYTTMNDVVPECLATIWQTYPCDVYVLDDSSKPEKRAIVDRIAQEKGFTLLRRERREGFKAGAINHWLKKYGATYDYLVLLDADSYVPYDWVEEALKYAEHPANSNVTVFQGLINIWNLDNRFVKILAPIHVLGQDVWEKRLANYLDAVFCYGHNVLIRIKPLLDIGGFVEDYVSEDFATVTKLASMGQKSRFVPLHTYEAMPENIRGFIKRQNKWTRGSMEFFSFVKNSKLTFLQKLLLLQVPLGHIAYVFIMTAMLLTIFGYVSTISHVTAFTSNLLASYFLYVLSIPIFQYVIATSLVGGVILHVKLRLLDVNIRTFMIYELLSKAIGSIMLPFEVKTMFVYLFNRKLSFSVTPKSEKPLSIGETVSICKGTIILISALVFGLITVNPLGMFFNVTWLAPFFTSPFIIYLFSRGQKPSTSTEGFGPQMTTLAGGVAPVISCLHSQSEIVSLFLNSSPRALRL